jgi:hypothetical protein
VAAGWTRGARARSAETTAEALRLTQLAGDALLEDEVLDQRTDLELGAGEISLALQTVRERAPAAAAPT